MYFPFIRYKKIFYVLSAILLITSVVSIFVFGLKFGIDFTGGSSLEITYKDKTPSFEEIEKQLQDLDLDRILLQKKGQNGIVLTMKVINEDIHQKILERLKQLGEVEEGSESFQIIGPVIGKEIRAKTKIVIVLAFFAILIYIGLSFRRVSYPVKSYIYGLSGLIALGHDVLIPLGVLVFLGKFQGVEIDIPIIVAFLTIIGYSINDSVVVFDRIRENLLKLRNSNFDLVVEKSLNQTLVRSLNTTLTTLLALFAIFFLCGETLRYFSLTLILGIFLGAYSSFFVATPLLVSFYEYRLRR